MVFVLGETGRSGDYAAGIQDFFYRDLKSFRLMLTAFSGYCRQIGMETIVINYFGREEVSKLLARFGFFQRHSQTNVFVYANPACPDFSLEPLLNPNRWHLTNAELLS